jgi:lysophospholipase L1-like esterase
MHWVKKIIFIIIITVLSVKCADLILGYTTPNINSSITDRGLERSIILREINPKYEAILSPSREYLQNTDSLEQKGYLIRGDEKGFIENGNHYKFSSKNLKTVIFFGGSTTEQLFVPEKFRWQSILERNLNRTDNTHSYRILNGGVSGNHSVHSILNFITKGLPLSPDYVVLMHNVNDLGLLRLTGSYWDAPSDRSLIQNMPKRPFIIFIREIKDLIVPNTYELLKILKLKIFNDDFVNYRSKKTIDIEVIESQFRSSLNTFIDISKQWGIEPILMTQFNRINNKDELLKKSMHRDDIDGYIWSYKRLNDVIREVSIIREVDLIDLARLIPSSNDYLYDIVHLNKKGSKLASEILTTYWNLKFDIKKK